MKMKNYLALSLSATLLACVQQPAHHQNGKQQTFDMKTVEEYHKQVRHGNTAPSTAAHDGIVLDASDYQAKPTLNTPQQIRQATILKNLPQYKQPVYSQGTTHSTTTSHSTTEILKNTPNEKQTKTVEKSETKWNSKGFSFGL
ncbi:hypothetical protein OA57_04965 [Chelonobacter oris]|uniref:Lipoprotein n=1 Tax=Chelonobacter oris TaxID=505317 RepID=A0A0A3AN27_9PAST|nr:hypothetical protein [Chelonobacter oris]KGQ70711.1 hypothetical protein OA57_04965 [Chelonobacter oris]